MWVNTDLPNLWKRWEVSDEARLAISGKKIGVYKGHKNALKLPITGRSESGVSMGSVIG